LSLSNEKNGNENYDTCHSLRRLWKTSVLFGLLWVVFLLVIPSCLICGNGLPGFYRFFRQFIEYYLLLIFEYAFISVIIYYPTSKSKAMNLVNNKKIIKFNQM
jgi:hypothetical protein